MCLPEPGPRCSHHAYRSYVKVLSALGKAETASEKERLTALLAEKQRVYDSTPKGQNELKREVMYADDVESKEAAQVRLTAGEALRDKQMTDYLLVKAKGNRLFKDDDSQGKLSRRMELAAVAMYSFADGFSDDKAEVLDVETISTKVGLFYVLGGKATVPLPTSAENYSKVLEEVPENRWVEPVRSIKSVTLTSWFNKLAESGYAGIAVVNINTSDVAFLDFVDAEKLIEMKLKKKRKLGGTTKWARGAKAVEEAFGHLPEFENASYVTDDNGVTVTGTGYLMKSLRTSGEIYLSEKKDASGIISYVVRRRHISNIFRLYAQLRPYNLTFSASISDSLRGKAETGVPEAVESSGTPVS